MGTGHLYASNTVLRRQRRWILLLLFAAIIGLLHPVVHATPQDECSVCLQGQGTSPLPESFPVTERPPCPAAAPIPMAESNRPFPQPHRLYPTGLAPPALS